MIDEVPGLMQEEKDEQKERVIEEVGAEEEGKKIPKGLIQL